MSTIRRMPPIASILVVLCYLAFTTLAILKYPLPYSPVDNWLSDLGNTQLSPYGAQFYNLGIVVTGLLVLVFYLTILEWRLDQNRVQNIMVLLTQFFGVIGSVSMILSGYYPINLPDLPASGPPRCLLPSVHHLLFPRRLCGITDRSPGGSWPWESLLPWQTWRSRCFQWRTYLGMGDDIAVAWIYPCPGWGHQAYID